MICPYCRNEAPWVSNDVIYGRKFGKSYMCYYCKPCDARVGCHKNTKTPLGTMANKELRELRMRAHNVIDVFWKTGQMTRGNVYDMVSREMKRIIHIGESDEETCREIIKKFGNNEQ